MEQIESRRSCRQYTEDPIPREDLEKICHAALVTPTAMNQQDIDVLVITDKAKLQAANDAFLKALPPEVSGVFEKRKTDIGVKNPTTCDAPAFFLLHTNERKYENFSMFHAGSVAMSITIAAKALGYDSLVVGIVVRAPSFWEEPFGIAKGTLCVGVAVGKAKPGVTYPPKEILCKAVIQ